MFSQAYNANSSVRTPQMFSCISSVSERLCTRVEIDFRIVVRLDVSACHVWMVIVVVDGDDGDFREMNTTYISHLYPLKCAVLHHCKDCTIHSLQMVLKHHTCLLLRTRKDFSHFEHPERRLSCIRLDSRAVSRPKVRRSRNQKVHPS